MQPGVLVLLEKGISAKAELWAGADLPTCDDRKAVGHKRKPTGCRKAAFLNPKGSKPSIHVPKAADRSPTGNWNIKFIPLI